MSHKNYDFNVWYNSYDPDFIDICAKSNVPEKWVSYSGVLSGQYKDSIIKPINSYVENLYPSPELISIKDNLVTLRQSTHAEILLLETDNKLKALDRPWIRQFYQSSHTKPTSKDCFQDSFIAYAPWFIDEDTEALISGVDSSPFFVYNLDYRYRKLLASEKYAIPVMVSFKFKKDGPHMQEKGFGKIKMGTPIFDITFEASDIIIKKIKDFYEERN